MIKYHNYCCCSASKVLSKSRGKIDGVQFHCSQIQSYSTQNQIGKECFKLKHSIREKDLVSRKSEGRHRKQNP